MGFPTFVRGIFEICAKNTIAYERISFGLESDCVTRSGAVFAACTDRISISVGRTFVVTTLHKRLSEKVVTTGKNHKRISVFIGLRRSKRRFAVGKNPRKPRTNGAQRWAKDRRNESVVFIAETLVDSSWLPDLDTSSDFARRQHGAGDHVRSWVRGENRKNLIWTRRADGSIVSAVPDSAETR